MRPMPRPGAAIANGQLGARRRRNANINERCDSKLVPRLTGLVPAPSVMAHPSFPSAQRYRPVRAAGFCVRVDGFHAAGQRQCANHNS